MAQGGPDLSIIVPTFQRAESARRCVTLLLDQTLDPGRYEVVVVVDGSTDGTADALRSLPGEPRLRVIETTNRGSARARNHGAEVADGRYLLFVDDDLIPCRELAAEHLRVQEEGGGVGGNGRIETVAESGTDAVTAWTADELNRHYEHLGQRAADGVDVYSGNFSVPRAAFLSVNGFDAALPTDFDTDLGCRLAGAGLPMAYIPAASATQILDKEGSRLIGETVERGRLGVEMMRRHPEMMDRLALSGLATVKPRDLLAVRALLALHVPPVALSRPVAGLARTIRKPAAIRVLSTYAYWAGVRQSGPGRDLWRSLTRPPVILMYHAVGAPGETATKYRVPGRRLDWQLRYLRARRFQVVALRDVIEARKGSALPPGRSVVLTFDDGYRDNYTEALPRLRRRRHPATVFVVTTLMGGRNEWDEVGELAGREIMSWDEARSLHEQGVEIGSHTRSHPHLTQLDPDAVGMELTAAARDIEREMGVADATFAYPFGDVDRSVRLLAQRAGYVGAVGVRPGVAHPRSDPFLLPRFAVDGDRGLLSFACIVELGHIPGVLRTRRRRAA